MAKKSSPGKKQRSTTTSRKPAQKKVKKAVPARSTARTSTPEADLKQIDKDLIKLMVSRISLLTKLHSKDADANSVRRTSNQKTLCGNSSKR
ncbi:MAG: hypothetical protein R3C11_21805 [Planctomycetaceae bacterium]